MFSKCKVVNDNEKHLSNINNIFFLNVNDNKIFFVAVYVWNFFGCRLRLEKKIVAKIIMKMEFYLYITRIFADINIIRWQIYLHITYLLVHQNHDTRLLLSFLWLLSLKYIFLHIDWLITCIFPVSLGFSHILRLQKLWEKQNLMFPQTY